jgi:hypothetical protein
MAISKINSKSLEDSTVLSADIADDSIIDADIKSDAAISQSKLVDVVDADINASAAIVTSKLSGAVTSIASHGLATSATTDTTNADNISSGTVDTARLGTGTADNTKFLRGDNTWQVVAIGATQLDLPIITGTLSVLSGGAITHTITNWSDDLSWTITPTNCTVGSVNASGEFVITQTSGLPSYTIVATTASLGLADSNTVTKNISLQLTAPTISSPADSYETVDVTYTITSTTADDDKLILNIGSANFTLVNVSHGIASKVGNTVECTGFTTNNPAVIIQYTAEATYSVTATSVKIDGSFGTSAASSADSITILNPTLTAPAISSPADVGTLTDVAYTITSNDANDNKLILDIGSSNFNFGNVNTGIASKVGNTVECTGFTTNNPVVTIQFTAEATYYPTAKAIDTTGYYHDSVNSSADTILINNFTGIVATGGQQSPSSGVVSGDYKIHTFTTTGNQTFTITTIGSLPQVEYLVVGGGGGGGNSAGGGGAGGFRTATGLAVTQTSYTVTVGAGGAGNPSGAGHGTAGGNSSFHTITSTGGGYGSGYGQSVGGSGGSGGGSFYSNVATGNAGGYSPSEGNNGGTGDSGGGGGAGAVGGNGYYASGNANGGIGRASSISGSSAYYAGGGGAYRGTIGGGTGGGGNGGGSYNVPPATAGAANTGGGGGGGGQDGGYRPSAAGGSGIVILKYKFQ